MTEAIKSEIQSLIKKEKLNCSIEEFDKKVDWHEISFYHKLSDEFIDMFQDKLNWYYLSYRLRLSNNSIEKFKHFVTKFNKKHQHNGKYFWKNSRRYQIEKRFYINGKVCGETLIIKIQ
jgi:hypothetical protein